ncbi:MAG: chemotaxis protein CheA [Pirellulales bacterium]|nr:chemotaxis protein CheA [Pirellulales bacterium]
MSNDLGLDEDFMATMLGDFLDESAGYLTRLNENLLALEESARALSAADEMAVDIEVLNIMFRDAHSLKGLSAMLQLSDINRLTHKVENVFDGARQGTLPLTRDVIDLVFQAVDRLTAMIDKLKDSSLDDVEYESIVDEIGRILDRNGAARPLATNSAIEAVLAHIPNNNATLPGEDAGPSEGLPMTKASLPDFPVGDPFADVLDETDITEKYLSIFIDETEQSLDMLSEALVSRENPAIDPLLVICHRIKGSAASIGLNRAAKLSHVMEDLLQTLREGGRGVTNDIADALLTAGDALRVFNESLKVGNRDVSALSQAYLLLCRSRDPAERDSNQASTLVGGSPTRAADSFALSSEDYQKIADQAPAGCRAVAGVVVFEPNLPLVELKARLICERLASHGTLFFTAPGEQQLGQIEQLNTLKFGLASESDLKDIRREINLEGVTRIEMTDTTVSGDVDSPSDKSLPENSQAMETATRIAVSQDTSGTPDKPQNSGAQAAVGEKDKPAETLRVDIERLDQLMNLTGQLVINKARFGQIGHQLKSISARNQSTHALANISVALEKMLGDSNSDAHNVHFVEAVRSHIVQIRKDLEIVSGDIAKLCQARTLVNGFSDALHQLDRVSDGIQKSVMNTRMVPIGPLFGRYKRVIRDITRGNGKDIELVIHGEKTELDKRMIDELGDPLIHMVRNSADHGIESPAEREAKGKPRRGTITLDAFHRGNRIIVQVQDDGKGLDPIKIRDKAISKGIISQQDAERLSNQQLIQLIWEPGFSTAEKVTEVSGRGMGMDIVRSKIEQLNGLIEIDSQPGFGTTITVKLPLTMAILPSLLTVIADEVFAIPVESVVEIVGVSAAELTTIHNKPIARVRGRVVSVVELSELFQWKEPGQARNTGGDRTLVVIGSDGKELGLVVERLIGQQDIVIKSLAENYRNVPGLAGASILGDGRVSLILDVAALIDLACRSSRAYEADTAHGGPPHRSPSQGKSTVYSGSV